jgi:probable selenium-dependent hydroxylase accessory protein YqeC
MTYTKTISSLREALDVQQNEVVSVVGAGGKTTLMFSLARELSIDSGLVITTTTTKIFPPSPSDTTSILVSQEEKEVLDFICQNLNRVGHITIASELLPESGKLRGISPGLVSRLIELDLVDYVIVEADGAAGRPLKAPNAAFEPVIPQCSTLVVPVVGLDALGCVLSEKNVFRSAIASKLTGLQLGETVSARAIVDLILHPAGIIRESPRHARIVPFINKIDLHSEPSIARDLAYKILDRAHPGIDRVALGQAQKNPPVAEVVLNR